MSTPKGSIPWNAGKGKGWADKRGYRWVYVLENGRRRARREHRVIVEKAIGRRLEPWEVVHHRDENPSNNSLDNLRIIEFGTHTSEHHTGSRKEYQTRRSMEAFALLREELKAERNLKTDLLAALINVEAVLSIVEPRSDKAEYLKCLTQVRAALAKAGIKLDQGGRS